MKTCITSKLYKLTLEKMVIGIEEPVLVKGIGELIAKVDSGNSGYNVIHGEDIVIQGNIINFKTFNKDGDERRVSKKIKDTIKINIGGGHIQDRPVVELDVQFGGEDYKKVPFSVTNRSDNEHKILISKDFVGNELEALIDVTKDNISNDGINVDYVTEGIMGKIGNAIGSAVNTAKKINNKVGRFADAAAKFNKHASGEYEKASYYEVPENVTEEMDAINNLKQQLKEDAELIRTQLPSQKSKLSEMESLADKDNIAVFKLLDYTGGTNVEGKNANPEFKKYLKDALEQLKKAGRARAAGNEKKTGVVKEAVEPTSTPVSDAAGTKSAAQDAKQTEDKEGNDKGDPTKQVQGQEGSNIEAGGNLEEYEEIFKNLESRNRAIFYLVNFKKEKEKELVIGEKLIQDAQSVIDNWNVKIAQGKDWSFKTFENAANAISKAIEGKGGKGLFAYCTGKQGNRSVEYCFSPGIFGKSQAENAENKKEPQNDISEFVQEYQQLNGDYHKLGGKDAISEEGINSLLQQKATPQDEMKLLVQTYEDLNTEYKNYGGKDAISEEGINALIDDASLKQLPPEELNEPDPGDSYDATDYGHHTEVESEETKIK